MGLAILVGAGLSILAHWRQWSLPYAPSVQLPTLRPRWRGEGASSRDDGPAPGEG